MNISESQRKEEISKIGLRPELTQLLLGELNCGAFSVYFEEPHYFYSQGSPENPGYWPQHQGRELLPLWEHSGKIYALDIANSYEGVSFYIETPEEFETYSSVDQAVFESIEKHVWEYGGGQTEIEESIAFASLVKLPNIEGLINLLSNYLVCTEKMITEYKETLCVKMP